MAKYFKRSEYNYVYGIMVTQAKTSANMFLQEYNQFRQTVPVGSSIWNEVEEQVRVSKWLEKAHRCQSLGTSLIKLTAIENYRMKLLICARVSDTCMVCGKRLAFVRMIASLKLKKNPNRLLNFN